VPIGYKPAYSNVTPLHLLRDLGLILNNY